MTKKIEDTTTKAIAAVQSQFQKMSSTSQPQNPGEGNNVTIEEVLPVATPINNP